MTKPIIFDGETHREMSDLEHAQYLLDAKEAIAQKQKMLDAQTAKALARQAVLDKLGLSADEATALLG